MMLVVKCLESLKILGIYAAALVLFVFICGGLAILVLSKFPNWTFNELVFPPKEVKHS